MSERQPRFETTDAELRPILWLGVGLAVLLTGGLLVSSWAARGFQAGIEATETLGPMQEFREGPSGPLLQASPNREIEEHRAYEERMLGSFEFIDEENGIVRIPIESAIDLLVREEAR